jgi:hypothetical protein
MGAQYDRSYFALYLDFGFPSPSSPSLAPTQILWNRVPTPDGEEIRIALPPVDSVG